MLRPCIRPSKNYSASLSCTKTSDDEILAHTPNMSDTEMNGGVALEAASPTHSQLADKINGGAMDVKSPNLNAALSIADSTTTSRLYVLILQCSSPPTHHS